MPRAKRASMSTRRAAASPWRIRWPGRSVTTLAVDGEQVGILIRAGEGETDEALVDGVAAAAQLALANARLQRRPAAGSTSLAASRRRLVGAADAERSRIDQELEVGVGQRLAKAERLRSPATRNRRRTTESVRSSSTSFASSVAELREFIGRPWIGIARGRRARARRSPGSRSARRSRSTSTSLADRWPTLVETTAYFVCSEGLANAAKHAHASRISVHVTQQPVTWSSRSWMTATVAPTWPAGPVFADSPTGSKRSEGP